MLTKLFNIVLLSGIIPEEWTKGLIAPIYKKKGDEADPNNYRGISLLSCVGKVFSSLLSSRLTRYIDSFEIMGGEQAGFRKGYSTVDKIFILQALLELYRMKKRKLYCCFVDYKKAFDMVPRVLLWQKLLSNNINGKIFELIKNLYSSAKSAIKLNSEVGTFFNFNIGVRQGDNLSPLLFALYLNDLQEFLAKAYNGFPMAANLIQDYVQDWDTVSYLKLFALLYADDTIVMAESRHELQAAMNGMFHYCNIWKLQLNTQKTKVVIFGSRKAETYFKFGNQDIEVVAEYTYLGVLFTNTGNLSKNISRISNVASRAMFAILKKARRLGLDLDIQLQLFDSVVATVALYGCEVWGFGNTNIIDKLQVRFCKILLKAKRSTPTCMVLGELGRLPIQFNIESRMLGFWFRCLNGNGKISCSFYKLLYKLHTQNVYSSKWLLKIRNILDKCGLLNIWNTQDTIDMNYINFKNLCKRKLRDYYIEEWNRVVSESRKCFFYKEYKKELVYENYLNKLDVSLKIPNK